MKLKLIAKKLALFWTLQTLGWLSVFVTGLFFYYLSPPYSAETALIKHSIIAIVGFGLSLLLRYCYRWLRKKPLNFLNIILICFFCSVIAANIWYLLFRVICLSLGIIFFKTFRMYAIAGFEFSLYLFVWSLLYWGINYWFALEDQKERTLKATALASQAQLQMLRYQINPHFLFNALTSIRALIQDSNKPAKKMVTELSEFLRYSLRNMENPRFTLREEIKAIRHYLTIEETRFQELLEISYDVAPEAENYSLPGLLLHPLVENAVKYGMQTSVMPLKILLKARIENGSLRIEISNSGRLVKHVAESSPGPDANGASIGIRNVRQRLEQSFPNRYRFELFEEEGWVRSVIEVRDE